MSDLTAVQQRIDANLQRETPALLELSHRIHAHPEIRFEEVKASGWLADELAARGFEVERGVANLPTAFRAVRRGRAGGPTVAILCEYDALPGLGHACGHNVIATMGAGAGFALAPLMDEIAGTLVVMGTPAEEGGGGKVIMLEAGVFDDVDAAMMIHPFHVNQANMPTLASTKWEVTYHGVPAHAAMAPHSASTRSTPSGSHWRESTPCVSSCGRTSGSTPSSPTVATRPTSSPSGPRCCPSRARPTPATCSTCSFHV